MGRQLSSHQPILTFEFFRSQNDTMHRGRCNGEEEEEEGGTGENSDEQTNYSFAQGCFQTDILASESGLVDGILLWWEVSLLSEELDNANTCLYSTQPGKQNWQVRGEREMD